MEAILGPGLVEHFQEYYFYYIVSIICLIPIVLVTRKWSVPLLLYNLEIFLYLCLMHCTFWVLVVVTRWFKEQSSIKALRPDGRPIDAKNWSTPIVQFWKKEEYDPGWLFWTEVALACIVFALVWRYRPIRVKRARKFKYDKKKKPGMTTKFGPGRYSPGAGRGGRK